MGNQVLMAVKVGSSEKIKNYLNGLVKNPSFRAGRMSIK